MIYLDKFMLPNSEREIEIANIKRAENGGCLGYIDNAYPCGLFSQNEFSEIDFDNVTIIYGGNGSGKSTLLNVIANKLNLKRVAPFNNAELFPLYVDSCKYRLAYDDEGDMQAIPRKSSIITSDDIFDYMLALRSNNEEISENIEEGKSSYSELKFGETMKFNGLEDHENIRLQVYARKKTLSRRKYLRKFAGQESKLNSNGETAIDYFNSKLINDTLYCLDEPENSLSPIRQLELKEMIEKKARYCGCQFIIATHSPFILSVKGAKIYDLDSNPVTLKKWWEVENTRTYFDFFYENKDLFLKD